MFGTYALLLPLDFDALMIMQMGDVRFCCWVANGVRNGLGFRSAAEDPFLEFWNCGLGVTFVPFFRNHSVLVVKCNVISFIISTDSETNLLHTCMILLVLLLYMNVKFHWHFISQYKEYCFIYLDVQKHHLACLFCSCEVQI